MTGKEWLAWRSVCMTSAQEQNGGPWDLEQGKWIRKGGTPDCIWVLTGFPGRLILRTSSSCALGVPWADCLGVIRWQIKPCSASTDCMNISMAILCFGPSSWHLDEHSHTALKSSSVFTPAHLQIGFLFRQALFTYPPPPKWSSVVGYLNIVWKCIVVIDII